MNEAKLIEAMGAVRRAMGLVDTFADGAKFIPPALIGVRPQLRDILDSLTVAVHELKGGERGGRMSDSTVVQLELNFGGAEFFASPDETSDWWEGEAARYGFLAESGSISMRRREWAARMATLSLEQAALLGKAGGE